MLVFYRFMNFREIDIVRSLSNGYMVKLDLLKYICMHILINHVHIQSCQMIDKSAEITITNFSKNLG